MNWINSLPRFLLMATTFFYIPAFHANAILNSTVSNRRIVCSTVHHLDTLALRKIKTIADFSDSFRKPDGSLLKLKDRKQLLKTQLQAIRQSPDKTRNQKRLLTILAVLAFLGVVAIMGIIGYSGGAGLWPGIGLVISIFLLVFVLKRIWKKRKNNNN